MSTWHGKNGCHKEILVLYFIRNISLNIKLYVCVGCNYMLLHMIPVGSRYFDFSVAAKPHVLD